MKLKLETNHLLVGGQFTESDFTVGDPRIIIHHLVKSVYSNPKVTMVQEIACNARDSHVENGNESKPIHIKIPSTFDPQLEIRDFGPGISPSRMQDVFIKIGNSTKRNDDLSDGSFGIGAKIPLSYTDQFGIRTIVNEDGHLTLRVYTCVRRDDYSLKLMELGEPHLVNSSDPAEDQHTGTTITIPILVKDISEIRRAVISKTEFWKVRPVLSGGDKTELEFPARNWFYQCDEFMFEMNSDRYGSNNLHAIVNGVYYPIQSRNEHSWSGNDNPATIVVPNFGGSFFLNFKIGEVKPSLSRESLHYDEATKAMIVSRVHGAIAVIKSKVAEIINNAPSYLEAAEIAAKFVHNGWLSNIDAASWKGIGFKRTVACRTKEVMDNGGDKHLVHDDTVSFTTFRLRNGKVKERGENHADLFFFSNIRSAGTTIFFTEKKRICYKSIKHYINTVGMKGENRLCFMGSKTAVTEWLTRHNMSELAANLVDLKDSGYVAPKRGSGTGFKVINKWDVTCRSYSGSIAPSGTFDPDDANDTGFYYIYDRDQGSDKLIIGGKHTTDARTLRYTLNFLGLKNVFGVAPGNIKFLNKKRWKPFTEFFDDPANADKIKILSEWSTYLARKNSDNESDNPYTISAFAGMDVTGIDPESPLRKWISAVAALGPNNKPRSHGGNADYEAGVAIGFVQRAKLVSKLEGSYSSFAALRKAAMDKYPMLELLDHRKNFTAIAIRAAAYVKMVDAQKTT